MKAEGFGYKNAWLALKGVAPVEAAKALSLQGAEVSSWPVGIKAAYEWEHANGGVTYGRKVFVTPAINGWCLCVGTALFEYADKRPPMFGDLISRLSADLRTEVQFFCSHRVVDCHGWGRATEGRLVRAYLFVGESGEKVLDTGAKSLEEIDLGFAFFDPDSPEGREDGYLDRDDLSWPDEENVMQLAERWSVNPILLGESGLDVPDGILGSLPSCHSHPLDVPAPRVSRRCWWRFWEQ